MAKCTSLLICSLVASVSGCATHTGTDALAGGALGAGTGALIGSATGHAGTGALIGAGVGAVGGAVVGDALDKSEQREAIRAQPSMTGYLSIQDVVYMTQSNVHESTIIKEIQSSRSIFNLTPADIIFLKEQGVSENVINTMIDSNRPVVYRRRLRRYDP
jgi:uncharacterized protein YcfJ